MTTARAQTVCYHRLTLSQDSPRQPVPHDLRVRTYVRRWLQTLVAFDGPTWRALRQLVRSPGHLASLQLAPPDPEDSPSRLASPIRLYLTINILFFLAAPWVNTGTIKVWQTESAPVMEMQPVFAERFEEAVERSGLDAQIYGLILDQRMRSQQGSLVWILIPIVALASFLLGFRRRRYFVEHLVLATNLISFLLVAVLAFSLVGLVLELAGPGSSWTLAILPALLVWMVWVGGTFFRGLRDFLGIGRGWAVGLTLWLGFALSFGYLLYLQALFLLTLFGMRDLTLPVAG